MSTYRNLDKFQSVDSDPKIQDALNRIKENYGDTASVEIKKKDLLKFGRNPNVGTASTGYTIWYTGQDQANETYVAPNTNSIDSVSSNNAGDTETVVIEGHTETGGEKTFVTQTATLNGPTRVALSTPLNRATRIYNSDSTDLTGEVYVYENTALTAGKPTDTTKIHLTIRAGKNQSEKASTSLSNVDYWIVTGFRGSVLNKTGTIIIDMQLQIRENGKVWRMFEDITATNSSAGIFKFNPYLIVPKNADVRLVSISSTSNTIVTGSIQGYLAKVV